MNVAGRSSEMEPMPKIGRQFPATTSNGTHTQRILSTNEIETIELLSQTTAVVQRHS